MTLFLQTAELKLPRSLVFMLTIMEVVVIFYFFQSICSVTAITWLAILKPNSKVWDSSYIRKESTMQKSKAELLIIRHKCKWIDICQSNKGKTDIVCFKKCMFPLDCGGSRYFDKTNLRPIETIRCQEICYNRVCHKLCRKKIGMQADCAWENERKPCCDMTNKLSKYWVPISEKVPCSKIRDPL